MDAVATIKTKLPFLVDLSAEDRKTLPKMGVLTFASRYGIPEMVRP